MRPRRYIDGIHCQTLAHIHLEEERGSCPTELQNACALINEQQNMEVTRADPIPIQTETQGVRKVLSLEGEAEFRLTVHISQQIRFKKSKRSSPLPHTYLGSVYTTSIKGSGRIKTNTTDSFTSRRGIHNVRIQPATQGLMTII